MRYQAVIFDMDGTLIDTSPSIISCAKTSMRLNGVPIPPESEFDRFIGPPLRQCFQIVTGITDEALLDRLADGYVANFTPELIALGLVYDGMRELIVALHDQGVKLGVATLKLTKYAQQTTDHFGLTPYFDAVCGSADGIKADKEAVMRDCMQQMGITDPTQVLMVGDSPYDQEGAKLVGTDFAAALYGYGYRREQPDTGHAVCLAEDVTDLARFLGC
ncbi:HAD family hydrolase [Neobittarella massiliensis]|uniref:HAD family hydrolase n=1 Tax=Neobittarella massiliensis (ex Bilen et al. 2018) TaxID=2041842 RepID=UPI000CF63F95|nr:HAD hydrolase-like protein [Neobittarella massiliensis]